jgi:aminoglycoside phosphotransferase family enzyme/predicted kinase
MDTAPAPLIGDQTETIAFLMRPKSFGMAEAKVEHVQTHGAHVFLCGDTALKLKRAVAYDYMDLSTPDLRHTMLLRELALNRAAAPAIYRDVLPVTRKVDGSLTLGGDGPTVDWVLRIARFRAKDELTQVAQRGALDDALAGRLGRVLAAYHAAAPIRSGPEAAPMRTILEELSRVFSADPAMMAAVPFARWHGRAMQALPGIETLLDARGRDGLIRRGHGDLHLRNIVLINGQPVPFDALEFDETLGTCDVLYDLAFLLMDLCHRGLDRVACRVQDAWLLNFADGQESGLAALPLFLSVRAAIRAMVLLQQDKATGQAGAQQAEAKRYMQEALAFLAPPPPICVAIGGYSGAGKSHLAKALSPHLGAAPGALWLASDALRTAGQVTDRALTTEAFAQTARDLIYEGMHTRAARALCAGHSVVLDATYLGEAQRLAVRDVARASGVRFVGLWATAPAEVLKKRFQERKPGLSDADLSVLERQMARGCDVNWRQIETTGPSQTTLRAALYAIRQDG